MGRRYSGFEIKSNVRVKFHYIHLTIQYFFILWINTRGYIITENFGERGREMELLFFFAKEGKLKFKGNLVIITKNFDSWKEKLRIGNP